MGVRIDTAATSLPHGRFGRGALHLTDAAARSCLARAHVGPAELGLIVNVGLYKDHGIAEPALASIIQDDIDSVHGAFSFDLLAGGCGLVSAAYLLDGFVGSGAVQCALVVAGDADPDPRHPAHRFPYAAAGGALLLRHDDGATGFRRFVFRTFPEHAAQLDASLRWRDGRSVLDVYESPSFAPACIEHGITVARVLLGELAPTDVDLVIASQLPSGFGAAVARGLGIPPERVPRIDDALARAHTAGPIAALEAAIATHQLARARNVLFVTAGAGITIGAALYANAPRSTAS
jgi:3-oxoacyl-[acyl-carrier-protein] synthase-3